MAKEFKDIKDMEPADKVIGAAGCFIVIVLSLLLLCMLVELFYYEITNLIELFS